MCFISTKLGGTVALNEAVLNWNAASPPTEWRALIRRCERLDTLSIFRGTKFDRREAGAASISGRDHRR